MFGLSPVHLLVLALVVLVLLGRGKVSEFMGDFGKGIKSFKEGMADETSHVVPPPRQIASPIDNPPAPPVSQPSPMQQPAPDAQGAQR